MDTRIWILGAPDPEMSAIETLLRECGEYAEYAVDGSGARVHPGNAYRGAAAGSHGTEVRITGGATWYLVECSVPVPTRALAAHVAHCDGYCPSAEHEHFVAYRTVVIDHHRPGDPGYGRPPSEFLSASSIGQVIAELARLGLPAQSSASEDGIPRELVLTAAADHCLGAAYRGECPGVDPDKLMHWRAESRAAFQRRPVSEVLADIERAKLAVRAAPTITMHEFTSAPADAITIRDMRTAEPQADARGAAVPELPEAALRLGEGYLAGPLLTPDGRHKIVCSGTPEQVCAFLEHWAPSQGLVDSYGDPARGFAGGYLP